MINMSSENNPGHDPTLYMPFVSDDRFFELTGIQKTEVHSLMVGARDFGSYGVRLPGSEEGSEVFIKPGNMENGSFYPVLYIESKEATTSIMGVGDTIAIEVELFGGDEPSVSLNLREGIQVQNERDFEIVPENHWKALAIYKGGVDEDRAKKQVSKTRKFLQRTIFR